MVSLSYGYGVSGHLNDCDATTNYTKTDDGNTSTFTIDNGDYFKLNVTVSGGNEETKVVNDNNLGVSTDTCPKIRWRYKTSNSSIKAKIIAEFSDASTQEVLADASSTTFTVGTTTLTAGKTLDHIRVYADHAVGTVYYDFVLVYKGDFTLPNVGGNMSLDLPPREAQIVVPGRDVDITQNLGSEPSIITLTSDLSQGNWTRTGDTIDAEVFLDIVHNRSSEPWQWLNTGSHQFKVRVHPRFRWINNGDGTTSRLLDLTLREYSLGCKSDETYAERWGIGL